MIGAVLGGKYRVVRLLGEGGMGAVYEAENVSLGKRVAVKTLLQERSVLPAAVARFKREAAVMASIDHEHIASILDFGEEAGVAFIVMELLKGQDLDALLHPATPMPEQAVLRVVAQALKGLSAAHVVGVWHRDIKPSNVFLVERPHGERLVKLVDFGIARSLFADDAPASRKVTQTGTLIGTPKYMSPEQLRGAGDADFRSDLWSVGVMMFEMLAGQHPYPNAHDLGQIFAQICFMPPPSIRMMAAWVSDGPARIVERAMQQDPAQRYQSAVAMLADVTALLEGPAGLTTAMLAAPGPFDAAPAAQGQPYHGNAPAARAHALPVALPPAPAAAMSPAAPPVGSGPASPALTTPPAAGAVAPAVPFQPSAAVAARGPGEATIERKEQRRFAVLAAAIVTAAIVAAVLVVLFVRRSRPAASATPSGGLAQIGTPSTAAPKDTSTAGLVPPAGNTSAPAAMSASAPASASTNSIEPTTSAAAPVPPASARAAGQPVKSPTPPRGAGGTPPTTTATDPFGQGAK